MGLLGALVSTNQPAAVSNLVEQTTGVSIEAVQSKDPVEREYQALMDKDDKAREEIDKWIRDSHAFAEKGVGSPEATLNLKIEQRLEEVKKAYEDFIERHPKHARVRLAYGSFLNDNRDDFGAKVQWEKSRELDPSNPAAWNNLANYYGHRSPVKKAFEYYAKAIELNPNEPVYYQNFATTVYLFRKDAMEFYNISETEVFDKALGLYRQAMKLAPDDFLLAQDYAQSFYGTKPARWEEGLKAWEDVLPLAKEGVERDGILIHLARCKINTGRFDEARKDLAAIKVEMYQDLKGRLTRKLEDLEKGKPNTDDDGPSGEQKSEEKDAAGKKDGEKK